jgi:hypothetical protein
MLSKEELQVIRYAIEYMLDVEKGMASELKKFVVAQDTLKKNALPMLDTIEQLQKEVERKDELLTEILETSGRLETWVKVKIRKGLGDSHDPL